MLLSVRRHAQLGFSNSFISFRNTKSSFRGYFPVRTFSLSSGSCTRWEASSRELPPVAPRKRDSHQLRDFPIAYTLLHPGQERFGRVAGNRVRCRPRCLCLICRKKQRTSSKLLPARGAAHIVFGAHGGDRWGPRPTAHVIKQRPFETAVSPYHGGRRRNGVVNVSRKDRSTVFLSHPDQRKGQIHLRGGVFCPCRPKVSALSSNVFADAERWRGVSRALLKALSR